MLKLIYGYIKFILNFSLLENNKLQSEDKHIMQSFVKSVCYHVPEEVGHPVHEGIDSTNELQVLGVGGPLFYQDHGEAGRDEGHGKYDTDCNHHINSTLVPENKH